jgi:acyl phosphate:glycerol-3-phosphate acyltransferase
MALLIGAFIVGSIPCGSLIASIKGIDLRGAGSGNIGATNVMRTMGRSAALLTLIGDMLKGIIPILLVRAFIPEAGVAFSDMLNFMPFQIAYPRVAFEGALGITAILGHNLSIFLKFRGGKGVATSLGVALLLSPYAALFAATIWLVTFNLTRYSSLGALVAFAALPVCMYMLDPVPEKIVISAIIALLIFITHRANIARLVAGTESKFTRKPS